MYDYNKIMVEMTKYMKYLFEQSTASVQMMFDHADKMMDFAVDQGDTTQDETRKRFKEWLESSKKIRDDYIKLMDEHFKKIEEHFETED